jgi:uncharacterized protein YbaP (TraB family)
MRALLFFGFSRLSVLLLACSLSSCSEPQAGYGWIAAREGRAYCLIPVLHLEKSAPVKPRSEVAKCVDEAPEILVEVDSKKAGFQEAYERSIASYLVAMGARPTSSQAEREKARMVLSARFPDEQIPLIDSGATDAQIVEFLVGAYQSWVGYNWDNSSENQLTARARAMGKPFSELETVQNQWDAIETSLRQQSASLLDETIRKIQVKDLELVLEAGSKAWREQNPWPLISAQRSMLVQYASERVAFEHLIMRRNSSFADALASRRSSPGHKPTVVLVGALHFIGEGNILDRLRAHNFVITPLP